jgi:hypothetical protein
MKKIVIFFALVLCFASMNAQENKNQESVHQFGLNAGFTTGLGFSYRYWPGTLGFQLTALPIRTSPMWHDLLGVKGYFPFYSAMVEQNGETQKIQTISLAATILYKLKEKEHVYIFAYEGNHLFMTEEKNIWNTGGGLGISFKTKVSVSLMCGYQAMDILHNYYLLPTAEISLMLQI